VIVIAQPVERAGQIICRETGDVDRNGDDGFVSECASVIERAANAFGECRAALRQPTYGPLGALAADLDEVNAAQLRGLSHSRLHETEEAVRAANPFDGPFLTRRARKENEAAARRIHIAR